MTRATARGCGRKPRRRRRLNRQKPIAGRVRRDGPAAAPAPRRTAPVQRVIHADTDGRRRSNPPRIRRRKTYRPRCRARWHGGDAAIGQCAAVRQQRLAGGGARRSTSPPAACGATASRPARARRAHARGRDVIGEAFRGYQQQRHRTHVPTASLGAARTGGCSRSPGAGATFKRVLQVCLRPRARVSPGRSDTPRGTRTLPGLDSPHGCRHSASTLRVRAGAAAISWRIPARIEGRARAAAPAPGRLHAPDRAAAGHTREPSRC